MKGKILLLLMAVLLPAMLWAQVPQAINYQAVARDVSGAVIANEATTVRISIISGTVGGTVEWIETHGVTTNAYGLFTLKLAKAPARVGHKPPLAALPGAAATILLRLN